MTVFSPFSDLGLKNRVVMAPMTRYACPSDGLPTDELGAYYIRRARKNVGLIIVESAAVNSSHAMGYKDGLQFHSLEHCQAWQPIVNKIHVEGAKVWLQIFHAGRLTVPEISGGPALSASALAPLESESYWRPKLDDQIVHFQTNTAFQVPQEIDRVQIFDVIEQFATSCKLAEDAGFDGVELHGAHGYLLHQFSRVETNRRTDDFRANEFKFLKLLVERCRAAVEPDFTLSYRLSLHMVDNHFVRYDPNDLDYINLVEMLEIAGVDVFHASEFSTRHPVFGGDETLHKIIRQATDKPVIACGRISSLDMANSLIDASEVDLVAFGRLFISNPDLAQLLETKNEEKIVDFDYNTHMQDIH